mmetsp:Transcript_22037/g.76333  ORF Transcript_22037/g.76333 Transcript_22037/m.76333 type:complete len:299 (-) Transcript_22037:1065-1961(-)
MKLLPSVKRVEDDVVLVVRRLAQRHAVRRTRIGELLQQARSSEAERRLLQTPLRSVRRRRRSGLQAFLDALAPLKVAEDELRDLCGCGLDGVRESRRRAVIQKTFRDPRRPKRTRPRQQRVARGRIRLRDARHPALHLPRVAPFPQIQHRLLARRQLRIEHLAPRVRHAVVAASGVQHGRAFGRERVPEDELGLLEAAEDVGGFHGRDVRVHPERKDAGELVAADCGSVGVVRVLINGKEWFPPPDAPRPSRLPIDVITRKAVQPRALQVRRRPVQTRRCGRGRRHFFGCAFVCLFCK